MSGWEDFAALGKEFLARALVPEPRWSRLEQHAKAQAFGMVKVWNDLLLGELRDSLVEAQREGWTPKEWSARADGIAQKYGVDLHLSGPGPTADAAYADLVYRMGVQNAKSDGEYAAQFSEEGKDFASYWRYLAIRDSRNDEDPECPNVICRGLHGKVFSKNDAEALVFWPPNHFGCRCGVSEVPARLLARRGWDVTTGADAIAAVGLPPAGFNAQKGLAF